MKRYLLFAVLSVLSLCTYAQKYACVDTDYILSNVPEYKQAQKELEERHEIAMSKETEN